MTDNPVLELYSYACSSGEQNAVIPYIIVQLAYIRGLILGIGQGVPNDQPAQLQKLARTLKLWIEQVYIYYLSSEQQRCWSDCADAHADLHLCCPQMARTFTHGLAHIVLTMPTGYWNFIHEWISSENKNLAVRTFFLFWPIHNGIFKSDRQDISNCCFFVFFRIRWVGINYLINFWTNSKLWTFAIFGIEILLALCI